MDHRSEAGHDKDPTIVNPNLVTAVVSYDYSRSFIQWSSQRDNIPRCAVQASCSLRTSGGIERKFFLSHPCAGEDMYAERNLIHTPVSDFHMVCEPGHEYMFVKISAGDPVEHRMAHRLGDTVPTRDGVGAKIVRMEATMRRFSAVRELLSDREVFDAITANLPITGRTSYQVDDDKTQVIAEYPVTVMNGRASNSRWQVDTGPVLLPDFSLASELVTGIFRQAYLAYNARDWAEVAFRRPIKQEGESRAVMHYANPQRMEVRNQLFVADVE